MERLPEGLNASDAPHFWQKRTPNYYPDWIKRVELPSERGEPVQYVLVNDEATLLYLVNQGTLTFHVGFSRLADLDRPVVDLSDVTGGDQRYTMTPGSHHWANSLVKVDANERYTLSGRALNLVDTEERPLGFVSYDVDKKLIHSLHVSKYGYAADTTLAVTLSPGDTAFYVTNASGWSNDVTEAAQTRR